jgi:hypothetical protein
MSAGTAIRCSRRSRPWSAIGQANFVVQPTFQVLCAIAVGICSGSAGSARAVHAASLSGYANRYFGVSSGDPDTISISGIGASSRHRPIGESSTSLENSRGKVAARSAATMPPNDWPSATGRSTPSPSLPTASS